MIVKKSGKSVLGGKEYSIPFQPSLAKAFDVCGALLIQQIHYWSLENRNIRADGHSWVYNTHQQWADQLEIYSTVTVRKKMKELEFLGVIKVGTFNKIAYDRTRWYRIDYEKLASVLSMALGGEWSVLPHPSGKNYHMEVIKKTASITKTTTEITTEIDSVSVPETTPEKPETLTTAAGKSNPKGTSTPSPTPSPVSEDTMNASDILNKHKETWATTLATTPVSAKPSDVSQRWKHQCVGAGMGFKEGLTGKEVGQFKLLFKALGPRANEVVDFVFGNWMKFTGKVGSEKGIDLLPNSPVVGFVLQHYEIALQLIAKSSSQQQLETVLINSFDKPKVVCNSSETAEDTKYVPSADDLQDAFAQLEAIGQKG